MCLPPPRLRDRLIERSFAVCHVLVTFHDLYDTRYDPL